MQPNGIIFWDWNGTLLDDVDFTHGCLNWMLETHGYPQRYDLAEYREIFGFPIEEYYLRAGFDFARHPYPELAARFMEHYNAGVERHCPAMANAAATLAELQRRGWQQAVLSASRRDYLIEQVSARGLQGFFTELLGLSGDCGGKRYDTKRCAGDRAAFFLCKRDGGAMILPPVGCAGGCGPVQWDQKRAADARKEAEDMYELDKAAFGRFLAQLRREKGMTQKELAATLYVSDKAVSKWERGQSVPDISLLVPLAEQLNVTVAELLQGRRVEEEQRFTREETEELIRKALTFSAEPPERRQARTKKYLPVYVICCVLGVAEALAVWAAGLADIEGALALLIIGVVFGVVYGAYAMFWMAETLPRYYDENRICNFAQGAFHIHIPGVYYNNRNWKHILRAFRVWSMASLVLVPPCTAGAVLLERATGWQVWGAVLVVYIASLFGAIVIPAKRFE